MASQGPQVLHSPEEDRTDADLERGMVISSIWLALSVRDQTQTKEACCDLRSRCPAFFSNSTLSEQRVLGPLDSRSRLSLFQNLNTAHGSCQEVLFTFATLKEDRRPNGDGTEQRHRHELAPRQNAIHIVHIDRQ